MIWKYSIILIKGESMEELISVIVPVYNVKSFLVECLDSIINQTYKNLEIILVDDGSNDGSEKICDEYKEKDDRVKVIRQKNSGPSITRNVGLETSNGRFLTFVDSDDYIHKDMIKILYNNIKKYNADISFCDYVRDENKLTKEVQDITSKMPIEEIYRGFYNKHSTVSVCMKLYKKEIFNDFRFPIGKIYEDAFAMHKILKKDKVFVYSDNKLYFYRKRKGSITRSKYSLSRLDYLEVLIERMEFMKKEGYEYFYAREFFRYINELKINYKNIKKYFPKEKEKMKELIMEFNKNYNKETRKLIIKRRIRLKMDLFHIKSLFIEKYIIK